MGKILSLVTSKLFLWIMGLALVAAGTFVVISKNRDNKLVEAGREAGETAAVSKGQSQTLQQNKDANDAEDRIRRGGDAAVAGCMSDARGDASGCERFGK